jgi:hypothetical protein
LLMKTLAACFVVIIGILTGCGTTSPLVNWNERIGNYSYDLALVDLGTPVRSTTLSDGSVVADWKTRSSTPGSGTPSGFVTQVSLDDSMPETTPPLPNEYLRLTFGPDQQLTGWLRYHQYYE